MFEKVVSFESWFKVIKANFFKSPCRCRLNESGKSNMKRSANRTEPQNLCPHKSHVCRKKTANEKACTTFLSYAKRKVSSLEKWCLKKRARKLKDLLKLFVCAGRNVPKTFISPGRVAEKAWAIEKVPCPLERMCPPVVLLVPLRTKEKMATQHGY